MHNLNPQTINAQALDGRFISTLPHLETAVQDFDHTHGWKCGVSMTIINSGEALRVQNQGYLKMVVTLSTPTSTHPL